MSRPDTGDAVGTARPNRLGQALLVVFFAAVGIGVVVALYDQGFLPIAGVFVAMILGPLILYLRRWQLAARHRALTSSLDAQLSELLADPSPPALGDGRPSPRSLELARTARQRLAAGDDEAATRRVEDLLRELPAAAGSDTTHPGVRLADTVDRLRRSRHRIEGARSRRTG